MKTKEEDRMISKCKRLEKMQRHWNKTSIILEALDINVQVCAKLSIVAAISDTNVHKYNNLISSYVTLAKKEMRILET